MSSIRSASSTTMILHIRQDQLATFKMIKQAARRGDQHVDAFVDQHVLFLERHAADQQRLGQFDVLGIGVKVFRHLCGQFARRAQNKAARHPRAGAATRQQR